MDNINAGENISIVDLRQPMDIEVVPSDVPGSTSYNISSGPNLRLKAT